MIGFSVSDDESGVGDSRLASLVLALKLITGPARWLIESFFGITKTIHQKLGRAVNFRHARMKKTPFLVNPSNDLSLLLRLASLLSLLKK